MKHIRIGLHQPWKAIVCLLISHFMQIKQEGLFLQLHLFSLWTHTLPVLAEGDVVSLNSSLSASSGAEGNSKSWVLLLRTSLVSHLYSIIGEVWCIHKRCLPQTFRGLKQVSFNIQRSNPVEGRKIWWEVGDSLLWAKYKWLD